MAISSAIDPSAVARGLGIKTNFQDLRPSDALFLPQRIALFGQGNDNVSYDTTKRQVTSASEAGSIYGFGSPIHLAAMQFFPINGDGIGTIPLTVYPLGNGGAAAVGSITPSGTPTEAASYIIRVNNIDSNEFIINTTDTVADIITAMAEAVNAIFEMPVIAIDSTPGSSTELGIEAKWNGVSSNSLKIEVIGSTEVGNTFAIVNPTGGLTNPTVDDALAQVGNIWETFFLNCLDIEDTSALNAFSTFGEGRWGALVRSPMVSFVGNTEVDVTAATSISDSRKTDRVNAQLVAPDSKDLPFVVAARQLARIVVVANVNPPHDYGSQDATGLIPGADGDQWNYIQRDTAIKKGSSTIVVKDSVINIADVVTFYHPVSEAIPSYRYVVDIVKLQTVLFNFNEAFSNPDWDGAPLIPDNQWTVNIDAKSPKMARAVVSALIDNLAANAIISDPDAAKDSVVVEIDSQNPKRLNISLTIQLSGNANIISIDLNFGFFFGG